MDSKKNPILSYATGVPRVRNLRFGVIAILCVGLALRIAMSNLSDRLKASLMIPLFIGGGVCAVIGLRRGAASRVLSVISLAFISYVCVLLFFVFLSHIFPS